MPISFEIHPSIGIARLGSSDEYFFGPEPVPNRPPVEKPWESFYVPRQAPWDFRDAHGKLKRQAARFRVFECERDKKGQLIKEPREITAAEASIVWKVHVANRKGAAKRFCRTRQENLPQFGRRNPDKDPKDLVIDAGPRKLEGPNHAKVEFDTGKFLNHEVRLGEAWTEADGALVILGGWGRSGFVSDDGKPVPLVSFSNNDFWYDDTSDGSVEAVIRIKGAKAQKAVPAWVIVAPFDFAPEIYSYVSLYDVGFQVAVDRGWISMPRPGETVFWQHVYPILSRVTAYKWVNAGAMRAETNTRHGAWTAPEALKILSDPTNADGRRIRRMLFDHLPHPQPKMKVEPVLAAMPRLHDHEYEVYRFDHELEIYRSERLDGASVTVLPLTAVQYQHMHNWATDAFVTGPSPHQECRCEAMDRIALEACSGGAFYPGMEAPRIMRDPTKYVAPFRLNSEKLIPGEVTERMAVPWQADFHDCQMDGDNAWWPATRPDKVFAEMVRDLKPEELVEEMVRWDEGLESREDMVRIWDQLGIVRNTQGHPKYLPFFMETQRMLTRNKRDPHKAE
jgi:hypothetical protein